jgi:hypothetical protein
MFAMRHPASALASSIVAWRWLLCVHSGRKSDILTGFSSCISVPNKLMRK